MHPSPTLRLASLAVLVRLSAACAFAPDAPPVEAPSPAIDGGSPRETSCDSFGGGCSPDATCDDGSGTVTCRCLPGFAGDGFSCAPVDGPLDVVVDVPTSGPYGSHEIHVPAKANWVNTGLYLKAGETASFRASGTWSIGGRTVDARGDPSGELQRGCRPGALAFRSGLRFEDAITCPGVDGTFTAQRDDTIYVGMIASTDLGEAYGDRLKLDGSLVVFLAAEGVTTPSVRAAKVPGYDFNAVESGRVELVGRHVIVSVPASAVVRDAATAVASIETLDRIYEIEDELRGMKPFDDQRVRFYDDDTVGQYGYMLAGNPVRCVPELMTGHDSQRILRASAPATDIWGFSHELGHVFSFANGAWVFQITNLESWPNIFTLRVLTQLGRTASQPNVATYCDGKDAYLESGVYATLRQDPFLQLCFLMEFTQAFGWPFWQRFYAGMNGQTNGDVGYDGNDEDRSVWSYVRDRFSLAAGEDVTPLFRKWRVPVR